MRCNKILSLWPLAALLCTWNRCEFIPGVESSVLTSSRAASIEEGPEEGNFTADGGAKTLQPAKFSTENVEMGVRRRVQSVLSLGKLTFVQNDPENFSKLVRRRTLQGDDASCNLQEYSNFLKSTLQGQEMDRYTYNCLAAIRQLKTRLAGAFGPIKAKHLVQVMCSPECRLADEARLLGMSVSHCDCLQLSTQLRAGQLDDYCMQSSARLICSILGYCGTWSCRTEDFTCPIYEWLKRHPCPD